MLATLRFRAALLFFAATVSRLPAAMSVTLEPSVPAPVPVGTTVFWNVNIGGDTPGTLWYRYRVCLEGTDACVLRDFGPIDFLEWIPSEREGFYSVQGSVMNRETGEVATATTLYEVQPLAAATPVIAPTSHPLVFLYSAPPCAAGGRMRVAFQHPDGTSRTTPYKPCVAGATMNFYLAGMRPYATYSVQHFEDTGFGIAAGPKLELNTPPLSLAITDRTVVSSGAIPKSQTTLLQASLFEPTVATDLDGNVVWYYPGAIAFMTRPEPGGLFWAIVEDSGSDPSHQMVRQFDLAGMTVLETNAARINDQLSALGKRLIGAFHHEARSLPDGKFLVLASTEQILTDVQGPGPVDIIGDMILVLDRNLNVVWAWDAFDYLDPRRMAILGSTCSTAGGCPPIYLAAVANDWLHGNSVALTPDGNLLYSARHQDWVIKIDYSDGAGTGAVLWRVGRDGDFQMQSGDPNLWFSHQHDANFTADGATMLVFDNGNTRNQADPSVNSRGQMLHVDESSRVVSLVLNVDLGGFSLALGSAQKLANGNYHFDAGWLPGMTSRAIEVDGSGRVVYALEAGTPLYRSFRMQDLYTP